MSRYTVLKENGITCGWQPAAINVPQVSILGPALHSILIHDLDTGGEEKVLH